MIHHLCHSFHGKVVKTAKTSGAFHCRKLSIVRHCSQSRTQRQQLECYVAMLLLAAVLLPAPCLLNLMCFHCSSILFLGYWLLNELGLMTLSTHKIKIVSLYHIFDLFCILCQIVICLFVCLSGCLHRRKETRVSHNFRDSALAKRL